MSTKRLVGVSVALGLLALIVVPLHAALRADPAVLVDEAYLRPACQVPFQAFPEPLCPRFVAGESPVTALLALIVVPLLARRPTRRRLIAISIASLAYTALQIVAPVALFTFPSASSGQTLPAFQADPGCGLVSCGLDHTLFHLVQVPFLLAMALESHRLQRALPERGASA